MINIQYFVIILSIFLIGTTSSYRGGYQYYPDASGWLKVHGIPATWQDAMIMCRLEGSVLASPITDGLRKVMRELQQNISASFPVYTGISSTYASKYFVSVEGVPLENMGLSWAQSSPVFQLSDAKKCVCLDFNGDITYIHCYEELLYFCYKENPRVPLTECGTFDKEYKKYEPTGACYKYHSELYTFDKAYLTCQSEGGHLLIINSVSEAKVMDFLEDVLNYDVYIGNRVLNSWFRKPLTIEGQLLSETGYENIAPNAALNINNETLCGTFSKEKYQKFTPCYYTLPFVCEKDPNVRLFEL